MDFIPYGKQNISQADIDAVVATLKSDFLTQGPAIARFEGALSEYCQVKYAYAVANATCALHLAYLALGVKSGDIVWTSPNTFLSTANAARMCGAEVDFVDICPQTYNMSVDALAEKLAWASEKGKLPKVVTPVHFAGQSCDMKHIQTLSHQYGFKIVEDAAHAIGGKYLGQPVGNCTCSDVTVFSFHPVKIITTGEGGALTTNDAKLANRIAHLRTHGMTRNPEMMNNPPEGAWYYQMTELGYNYRITDIQCALGYAQLQRLDDFITKRHQILHQYHDLLSKHEEITLPYQTNNSESALHLYPIQVPANKRKKVFDHLRSNNVGVNVHYIPVHLQPYYQRLGFMKGDFPESEKYYDRAISLPMYPNLTGDQVEYIYQQLMNGLY